MKAFLKNFPIWELKLPHIHNFSISHNSYLQLQDTIWEVILIADECDYLKYISSSLRDFKVLGAMSNTILSPNASQNMDILISKSQTFSWDMIEPLWNGIFLVDSTSLLSDVCWYILNEGFDATHLLWIPWTIAWAVANNSGSWKLKQSIFDNILEVRYYQRDRYCFKTKEDILFSYRNSEFKHTHNIYISQVLLQFPKESPEMLQEKRLQRFVYRKKMRSIYKYPSLWTYYISNHNLAYKDSESIHFSLRDNKLLHISKSWCYWDYLDFANKILNWLFELEIETVYWAFASDYVAILYYDMQGNVLLQERDSIGCENMGMVWLFWWGREWRESIQDALVREIQEELGIKISYENLYFGLFMKWNKRCFIFRKEVDNFTHFLKKIVCSEWRICLKSYHNSQEIILDTQLTLLTKKVLLYHFRFNI